MSEILVGRSVEELGFESQDCQTPEPKLRGLPKVTEAVSTAVIPWIKGHELWVAENEWETSTSRAICKCQIRATCMSPSKLLKHTENGMWPAAGERDWNADKTNWRFTASFIYKKRKKKEINKGNFNINEVSMLAPTRDGFLIIFSDELQSQCIWSIPDPHSLES